MEPLLGADCENTNSFLTEFNILYPFATFLFLVATKGLKMQMTPSRVQLTKKG